MGEECLGTHVRPTKGPELNETITKVESVTHSSGQDCRESYGCVFL